MQHDFSAFRWDMVESLPIPQRFATCTALLIGSAQGGRELVVPVRSRQNFVSADGTQDLEEGWQCSMSCAEGMLNPDDSDGTNDRPNPFLTSARALSEELGLVAGEHFDPSEIRMLALGYDSNRCQPVGVFSVEADGLDIDRVRQRWKQARDRAESVKIQNVPLAPEPFLAFLRGRYKIDSKPARLFSNHQLLGASFVYRAYCQSRA